MLEWIKLLATVFLGSGVSFTLVKTLLDRRKEKQERTEATKHIALRLAILFEAYVIECAEGVSSHQTADEYNGDAGARLGKVLALADLPIDDAYRFLDTNLLNSIYAFPQRCLLAQKAAEFWADVVGDRDAYFNTVKQNTLKMGSEALDISRNIRQLYGLPPRLLRFDKWDIDNFMMKEVKRLEDSQKRIEEAEKRSEEPSKS